MEITFEVHRAREGKVSKMVDIGSGTPVAADINGFEVELVSTLENAGTWVARFVGAHADEARQIFVEGEKVVFNVLKAL